MSGGDDKNGDSDVENAMFLLLLLLLLALLFLLFSAMEVEGGEVSESAEGDKIAKFDRALAAPVTPPPPPPPPRIPPPTRASLSAKASRRSMLAAVGVGLLKRTPKRAAASAAMASPCMTVEGDACSGDGDDDNNAPPTITCKLAEEQQGE